MKNERLYELIVDWLAGNLDEIQEVGLKIELQKKGYNINDLKELQQLIDTMDQIDVPEPGTEMSANFYSMLQKEEAKSSKRWNPIRFLSEIPGQFTQRAFLRPVFVVLILLIGFGLGYLFNSGFGQNRKVKEMSSEIQYMQETMMLALLEKPAATDRIQAINMTSQMDDISENIVESMLYTLNNDPNDNVRLITAEALLEFARDDTVREGLMESIEQQDSPMIQMTLADGLVALDEKRSVPYLRRLLDRDDLFDVVRDKIETGVQLLSKI